MLKLKLILILTHIATPPTPSLYTTTGCPLAGRIVLL